MSQSQSYPHSPPKPTSRSQTPSTPPTIIRTYSPEPTGPTLPSTPDQRPAHRAVRNLTNPPVTPNRSPAAAARDAAHLRSPTTPATLNRAINTALPASPHIGHSTPPSSFPSRLGEAVELHPLTPRRHRYITSESPFDDRHSIVVEELKGGSSDEDPFEFAEDGYGAVRRQKTMKGYTFTNTSPRWDVPTQDWEGKDSGDTRLGSAFMEVRPISENRRSLYPSHRFTIPSSTFAEHPDLLPPVEPAPEEPSKPASGVTPIRPTFRGLFFYSTKRDWILYFAPAFVASAAAAMVQPFMSTVIGDVFDIFVRFPVDASIATAAQQKALKDGVMTNTLKLLGAGAFSLTLNYAKGALWQRHGEVLVDRLRKAVFEGVQNKEMAWYDLGMGLREEDQEEGETIGTGGLMAKFTRETDDVRLGTATSFGNAVQYFVTFVACFILAMVRSPILALVTLSTIPIILILNIVTQSITRPMYEGERRAFAEASTNVERATSAISTVKVHNAQKSESERFEKLVARGVANLVQQAYVWATTTSLTDFFLLSTFVVGFWYGAKVVRDGKASPGTVMTVFWACLLGATYLQMVVPQLMAITKAKNSMASLRTVIQDDPSIPSANNPFSPSGSPVTPNFPAGTKARPLSIKRIRPIRCRGEFNLKNISFAYPSRPDNLVLRDVTLFIPPGETTFIVGGSGSGKSTIAQLLLRLYIANGGEITMDDQSFGYLDENFCREHIAAVQQGCILFDMSVHDNVAMGLAGAGPNPKTGVTRHPGDVSREEVVEACKMAMIHDFIESLPSGYETKLGTGGSALSGGQRQRLAIARARIRDPTVLILDEATSALDATSRVVVFENMKGWRKNKTTVVITHDLSQIVADDFVYVMKDGVVAEQGFRSDLMRRTILQGQEGGVFAEMAAEQAIEPLAPKLEEWRDRPEDEEVLDAEEELERGLQIAESGRPRIHASAYGVGPGARPESGVYLDILEEYSRTNRLSAVDNRGQTLSAAQKRLSWTPAQLDGRRNSRTSLALPPSSYGGGGNRSSLVVPSRPSSRMSRQPSYDSPGLSMRQNSFETASMARVSSRATEKGGPRAISALSYRGRTLSQNLDDDLKAVDLEVVTEPTMSMYHTPQYPVRGLFSLIRYYFPTVPSKPLVFIGLLAAIAHGVSTPVWSFFLAKLMTIVGGGGTDPTLTMWGLVVLAVTAAQAIISWLQEYLLFRVGAQWSGIIRTKAYTKVLNQDKGWFDESQNAPSQLVQALLKDADDMRQIIASVMGKILVFISMVGLGIIWALIVEWRLTLVGLGLAPGFAIMMIAQEMLIGRAEVRNKAKREDLATTFYESISNVRGIRAMALESTFRNKFEQDARNAKATGKVAAWYVAIGVGAAAALPLFAQALLNWVGAEFMIKGYLSYPQMLQVFNLVLFSLTFGSAMLDFIPTLAKAKAAARDFERFFALTETTSESAGDLRFPITGQVTFSHVKFAYPSRADVPVLTDVSFSLTPGECVAIVGPSGSGKSTIAALLQRLYDPSAGQIAMDKYDLARAEPKWLRNHIAVVSQSANLFDGSVSANIAYGSEVSRPEIERAARSANIHEFIMSLPEGYDTNLGENAALISGGQAQRLQIARALVRRSHILILDECTSALDVENQRAILDTIVRIKESRTTVFITHSVEAMKRCDRVICLGEGVVAEEGRYDELVARGGVFAQLMKTGEWE